MKISSLYLNTNSPENSATAAELETTDTHKKRVIGHTHSGLLYVPITFIIILSTHRSMYIDRYEIRCNPLLVIRDRSYWPFLHYDIIVFLRKHVDSPVVVYLSRSTYNTVSSYRTLFHGRPPPPWKGFIHPILYQKKKRRKLSSSLFFLNKKNGSIVSLSSDGGRKKKCVIPIFI